MEHHPIGISAFEPAFTENVPQRWIGNRPDDYTEISDDFQPSEKTPAPENGGAKPEGDIEELYENSSSIIRVSKVDLQVVEDATSKVKATSAGGKPVPQPLAADVMKHKKVTTTSDSKKANPKNPQLVPQPQGEKAREVKPANGTKKEAGEGQAPAFCLDNPSAVGHYQNVQPVGLKKAKPVPKVLKPEPEEVGNVYAKVQKPKPKSKILNGNTQQLNYVEVEFSQSPVYDNKTVQPSKSEQPATPPTTYTDVIHKDGKIMLVSPSS